MDRRQLISAAAASSCAMGVTVTLTSLQPALANYHDVLAPLGGALIAAGLSAWGVLWATVERGTAESRKYITLTEVGRVLYDTGERSLRDAMAEGVPSVFRTLGAAGCAYAAEAAKELGLQFYGRRGEGVRIEPIDNDEAEPGAFLQAFGKLEKMHEVSIERRDLPKVRRYYKSSVSTPPKT